VRQALQTLVSEDTDFIVRIDTNNRKLGDFIVRTVEVRLNNNPQRTVIVWHSIIFDDFDD
jgi:hypothetical protein